jgi:hypothetical protein
LWPLVVWLDSGGMYSVAIQIVSVLKSTTAHE